MKRYRPTVALVDLEAIRHNVRALKPAGAELMAVVKADAYGHGATEVARAAVEAGATWLGVALAEEGLALRDAGIENRVLVLSELPPGSELDAIEAGLTPTIYSDAGLAAVARAAKPGTAVHVKVDTGLHRVGVFPPENLASYCRRVREAGLQIEGVWTHFARSEDDGGTTKAQIERFARLTAALAEAGIRPRYLHAANSAATVLYPEAHFSLVRPGLAVYGLAPGPAVSGRFALRPALRWRSEVSFAKRLPAGEAVSYGHTYRLEREATIATVPVGYADGYTRRLSGRAEVLVRGRRMPVAGNITMDQILVDCGDEDVRPGEEVVLLGRQGEQEITAEELGERSGTINYEIVCNVGARVPREYTG